MPGRRLCVSGKSAGSQGPGDAWRGSALGATGAEIRLNELNNVDAEVIDLEALKAARVVTQATQKVKVILSGEVTKAVKLKGIGATKGALAAIEKAGGSVEA